MSSCTELLSEELKAAGFSVDRVADGVEAVLKAAETGYDIALLDMKMPNFNGLNAIKILKRMDSSMPIISYSGSIRQDFFAEVINAGALMFVPNPFSPNWMIS